MAKVLYSTHYTDLEAVNIWDGRLAGLFQIKEESDLWSGTSSSPSPLYPDLGSYSQYPSLDDYDTARLRPNP